jgi:uncharacterized protein (TIGR03067 family)
MTRTAWRATMPNPGRVDREGHVMQAPPTTGIAMRHPAILVGLCAVIALHAETPRSLAGEEAIAAIKKQHGYIIHKDYDDDQPVIAVTYWYHTGLTDGGLKEIVGALERLPALEMLNLDCTQVTDRGLAHLKGLTRLSELSLKATRITDAGLKHLEKLSSLKKLDLRLTAVSRRGVESLRKALPRAVIAHSRFDEPAADLAKLRGRWRLASAHGEAVDPQSPATLNLVVVGDELAQMNKWNLVYICHMEPEPSRTPKAMLLIMIDTVPGFNSRSDRFWVIYKVEGDTLTISRGSWTSPPLDFSKAEVYQRVDDLKP